MKQRLVLTFIFISHVLSGQPVVSEIKMIPLQTSRAEVVPLGALGFVLFEYQAMSLNDLQIGLPIEGYDLNLTPVWKNVLPISKGLQIKFYETSGDRLFLGFGDQRDQHLELFQIDLRTGQLHMSFYRFSNPFTVSSLLAQDDYLWLTGVMSSQGVVFALDPVNNNYRILPVAFSSEVSSVQSLRYEPEKNEISFLLETEVRKQRTYVYRKLEAQSHRVLLDLPVIPPPSLQLTDGRLVRHRGEEFITGTFYKKNPDQTQGVYLYRISQGVVDAGTFQHFKELDNFHEYSNWSADKAEWQPATKRGYPLAVLDQVLSLDNHVILSLELMEKQYQPKGALQQEFERSQLVNQLDEDQFGRRSFDLAAEGQTAEERIYQRSATDIIKYRYRDALVNQPLFRGYGYERTVLLTFDQDLNTVDCQGIRSGKGESNLLNTNTYGKDSQIWQVYDHGGHYASWFFNPVTKSFNSFQRQSYLDGKGRLFQLTGDDFLATQLVKEGDQFFLKVQTIQY